MTALPFEDPATSGVYRLPPGGLASLEKAAARKCLLWLSVSLGKASSIDDALQAMGDALAFPEWYGINLDALRDCLSDLGWRPAAGYVLVLTRCNTVLELDAAGFSSLLRVIADVAALWREQGIGFWCLVDAPLAGLPQFPDTP